jgi:hypothetical protein
MKDKRQYLIELDSAIGDGDLGLQWKKASRRLIPMQGNQSLKPGDLLMRCGMQIVKVLHLPWER